MPMIDLEQFDKFAAQFLREEVQQSRRMKPDDPAYWMLFDGVTSTPVVHSDTCYICRDSEYAQMGLPLCRECPKCGGHIAADDSICDDCGYDEMEDMPVEGEFTETLLGRVESEES